MSFQTLCKFHNNKLNTRRNTQGQKSFSFIFAFRDEISAPVNQFDITDFKAFFFDFFLFGTVVLAELKLPKVAGFNFVCFKTRCRLVLLIKNYLCPLEEGGEIHDIATCWC